MSAEQKMNASPLGGLGKGKKPADLNAMQQKHVKATQKKHVDPFKDLMNKRLGNEATRKKIRELKTGRYDFFDDEEEEGDVSNFDEEEDGKEMNLDTSDENEEEEDDYYEGDDVSKSLSSGDEGSEDSYENNKKKKKSKPILTQQPLKRKFEEPPINPLLSGSLKKPRNFPTQPEPKKEEHQFTVKDEARLNQLVKIIKMNIEELTIADENFDQMKEEIIQATLKLEAQEKSSLEASAALERNRATASPLVVPTDENAQHQLSERIRERFLALEGREALTIERENALALKVVEQEKSVKLLIEQEEAIARAQQTKEAEQNNLAKRLAEQEHALALRAAELNTVQVNQEKNIAAKRAEQNKQEQEIAASMKRAAEEERILAFKTTEYNTLTKKFAEDQSKLQKEQATLTTNLNQFTKQREALDSLKSELEKKEKALGALAAVVNAEKQLPLADLCHAKMMSSNTNTLSYEDMSSIVPEHLMRKLGHFAGKMPLKYNSFSNDEYIMVEVTSPATGADVPPLVVMRHVDYKQFSHNQ